MIPQEKIAAVSEGLREAFGVTEFEDIRKITGGRSPGVLVFRIVVRGRPFLLRIIMRTDDSTRHFTCMKAAAEADLAPHLWYASIEDRISITDFVGTVPFPVTDALTRLPASLRKLHALPPFGRAPFNTTCTFLLHKGPALGIGPPLDGYLQTFRASNILPQAESEEFFARYAEVAAVYPYDDGDMVSSHNDLFKPDNILFDGHRVWLVDWEAAFLNDRYADLAAVANLVVTNDAEERVYLQEYFGQAPDEYRLARFFLMQQVAHMFYAMVFLSSDSAGKPVHRSENATESGDFHRRFWSGEINLAENHMKALYGRIHWEQLLQNMRQARFNEALRIVSDRHACP